MRPQEPTFPSFSLVLSQGHAQYLTFPWTPIIYQAPNPVAQTPPVNANPLPTAAIQTQPVAPNILTVIIRAIRNFFARIVTKLKALSTS